MPVKRVDPAEAAELVAQGWRYVDVRSIPEFEQGHPTGATNIPLAHFVPGRGMSPNPEFAQVFSATFGPDDKILTGCKTGSRSLRAAEIMTAQGYTNVIDVRGGYEGEPGVPGWRPRGLPIATTAEPGRSYAEVKAAAK